jgi:Ca2+-binding RTX toxin-like protein
MATIVNQDLVVPAGDIRNYSPNGDNGISAALWFVAGQDSHQPSLINYGVMQFQSNDFASDIFIDFDTSNFWDQAQIQNYGTISASAPNALSLRALFGASWSPDLYNAGTISAQAQGQAITYESWDSNLTITNSATGTLSATAQNAFALYIPNGGTITNAGQILANATGGASVGNSYAISTQSGALTVINSGLIQASDNSDHPYATAISFYAGHNVVVNSGTIRGDYAITEVNPYHYQTAAIVQNTGLIEGIIDLKDGSDQVYNAGHINGTVDLGADDDIYDGHLGAITGTAFGGDGNDLLIGGAGRDTLNGGSGDDVLFGGGGDTLIGGSGADTFVFTMVVPGAPPEVISDFETGIDHIDLRPLSPTSVTISGSIITAETASGTLTIQVSGAVAQADIITGATTNVTGTAGSDALVAGPGGAVLTGGDSPDLLVGGAGNDTLIGGGGDTTGFVGNLMWGGAGDDTYVISDHNDVIVESPNAGYDTIEVVAGSFDNLYDLNFALPENVERIIGWGGIGNALDNVMVGSSGHDMIRGMGGADTLDGGSGDDILTGGDGADTLTGGDGHDQFVDTKAGLNGDTITDFSVGDRIIITDATIDNFTFSVSGNTLTYTGGSLTFSSLVTARVVATASSMPFASGVQLMVYPHAVHDDFNGSGHSDVLFQDAMSGQMSVWFGGASGQVAPPSSDPFAGATIGNGAAWTFQLPNGLQVAGMGDFNGDGRTDILTRSSSGTISDWVSATSGGFTDNTVNSFVSVDNSWHIAGIGDFNADGRSDILWRNDNGVMYDFLGTTNGGFVNNGNASYVAVDNAWHVAGTGDFNGDGSDDILWRNDNGVIFNFLGTASGGVVNNGDNSYVAVDNSWHIAGVGDFNGDGHADILWRNDSGVTFDFLGSANGGLANNGDNSYVAVDPSWHVVSIGDFNGDGRADILWGNDTGAMFDFLGTANGGFINNAASSLVTVSTNLHVQDPFV